MTYSISYVPECQLVDLFDMRLELVPTIGTGNLARGIWAVEPQKHHRILVHLLVLKVHVQFAVKVGHSFQIIVLEGLLSVSGKDHDPLVGL